MAYCRSGASARIGASVWPTCWPFAPGKSLFAKRWRRWPPIPRISSERITFEGSGPPPSVVVDANLLYPFHLRNLLVQFGVDLVIAPRWTTRINAEWIGNLVVADRVPKGRLLTLDLMNRALPAVRDTSPAGRARPVPSGVPDRALGVLDP